MIQRWHVHALAFVLGFCAMLFALQIGAAYPHSWYSGVRNPTTGEGCCGGRDCFPLTYDQFYEDTTTDEYVVTLKNFDLRSTSGGFNTGGPGRSVWRIAKSKAQPTPHMDGKEGETGFHACIWGGKLRCFMYPSFS